VLPYRSQSSERRALFNLESAKALGLSMPDKLLAFADEVME
jgi:hypothetical protein